MTLTNEKLIQMIQTMGEVKVHSLLVKKIEDDEYRKEYHRKYNTRKTQIDKIVREQHPEIYLAAKSMVN